MSFCRNCGKQLKDGARFCSGCGTPQETVSSDGQFVQGATGIAKSNKKLVAAIVLAIVIIVVVTAFYLTNKKRIAKNLLDSYLCAAAEGDYDAYVDACIPDWRIEGYDYKYDRYGYRVYTYDSYVVDDTDDLHYDFKYAYGENAKWKIDVDEVYELSADEILDISEKFNKWYYGDENSDLIDVKTAYQIECSIALEWKNRDKTKTYNDTLNYDGLVMIKVGSEWSLYIVPDLES